VKLEVLESIKKVALDGSGRNSAKKRAEASLQLCWAYIDGFGTAQDIHGALAWAEKAAELGSVSAGGLIKRIFESAQKTMAPDLQQRATEWQFKAVRSGSSIARDDLRRVDSDQCASAEEPFRIDLGAEMFDTISSNVLHFDAVDAIFHPRNRANQRSLHLQAKLDVDSAIFSLSLKKNTPLHAGAAMGVGIQHFESYLEEFSTPEYINAEDVAGNTPLHVALRCNHSQHAKCILKHGADAAITNNRGESPSHWLVYVDKPGDLVDLLAKNGATFDAVAWPPSGFKDPYGFIRHGGTPLHWAVEKNMLEIVNKLLDHGADPEFIYEGYTPIDLAVERNNSEILRALLSKSKQPPVSVRVCTNPNASGSGKSINGENYLNFAVGRLLLHDRWLFHGRAWVQRLRETIHVIQDFGLNPETEHPPMQVAALTSTGSTEILELLVEEGFDNHPEGKAIFWQDLLHGCIRAGQPFILHFLFEQYVKYGSLKELSRPEELLLKSAESMNCDSSIMEKILETRVDINCRDKLGKSPLVLAVGSRNYELATFLLSRGADINARYFGGGDDKISTNVLFELIVSNRDIDLGPLKFLLEPLHPYVDKSPDFLVALEQQVTAHHLACQTGNIAVVKFLLKKFPNKDQINFPDVDGWTALHYAVFNGHLEVVKMLCKAGADVNAQIGARDVPRRKRKTVLDFCFSWSAPSKQALEEKHGRQMTREDVYLNRLRIADHLKTFGARRADRKLISRPQPLRFAFWAVTIGSARLLSEALRRYDMPSIRQPILDGLLFDACSRQTRSTSVVQCLINAGANLHARSKKSNTPLHMAAICKEPLVIHFLLQRGAEVNPVNDHDHTPLWYALQNKQPAAIRALKRAGGRIPMLRAVFNKMFTDRGIEPPNLSGAELPKFKLKLRDEPSDESGDEEEAGEPEAGEDE